MRRFTGRKDIVHLPRDNSGFFRYELSRRLTQINADNKCAFDQRLSAFIGGFQFFHAFYPNHIVELYRAPLDVCPALAFGCGLGSALRGNISARLAALYTTVVMMAAACIRSAPWM